MENKYYTPKIEELHKGFECEILSSWGWQKGVFPSILFEDTLTGFEAQQDIFKAAKNADLRVKYLDEQDIIDCGFEKENEEPDKMGYLFFKRSSYDLAFYPPNPTFIEIDNSEPNFQRFIGTIKNKSELKKLLKQLGF